MNRSAKEVYVSGVIILLPVHGEQELEFGDFQEVFEILPSPVERDFVQVADDDDAGNNIMEKYLFL